MKNTVCQENSVPRSAPPFDWRYLLLPENADTACPSRLAGACKTVLWFGMSVLVGLGLARLC